MTNGMNEPEGPLGERGNARRSSLPFAPAADEGDDSREFGTKASIYLLRCVFGVCCLVSGVWQKTRPRPRPRQHITHQRKCRDHFVSSHLELYVLNCILPPHYLSNKENKRGPRGTSLSQAPATSSGVIVEKKRVKAEVEKMMKINRPSLS
ncbi:hypothetical protein B0T11DRAFT_18120 [Plectosphaerella cucumerina]|uniref:Uncharacterized protein n=1 Tax=Plectosphaerella cucumerina TaxID=40658 RepID=A0A8K0TRW7_9PEZI|nr:hypothetical protein B0T11DRAFT_18120 [Plectosphaerella cucumerina]